MLPRTYDLVHAENQALKCEPMKPTQCHFRLPLTNAHIPIEDKACISSCFTTVPDICQLSMLQHLQPLELSTST